MRVELPVALPYRLESGDALELGYAESHLSGSEFVNGKLVEVFPSGGRRHYICGRGRQVTTLTLGPASGGSRSTVVG